MGDMSQRKIDELFSRMLNIFGIAEDMLIVGFSKQDRDHMETLEKELWICMQ